MILKSAELLRLLFLHKNRVQTKFKEIKKFLNGNTYGLFMIRLRVIRSRVVRGRGGMVRGRSRGIRSRFMIRGRGMMRGRVH